METKEIILYQNLNRAILEYDDALCVQLCKKALEQGLSPLDIIKLGLTAGMEQVGTYYQSGKYFIPELLLCSDTLYAGLEVVKPHLKADPTSQQPGKIVMGVVEGDNHDIGKNLLKAMFTASQWEVHDLGKDVPCHRFVEQVQVVNADVVALSALMTTTMMAMPEVITRLREVRPNISIIVGGAALSGDVAKKFGADGYAPDIVGAVAEAHRLTSATIAQ